MWNTVHNVKKTALSMLCNVAGGARFLAWNTVRAVMAMRTATFMVIISL